MASLVPSNFDIASLPQSEQRVLGAFLDGLAADWLVLPSLRIRDRGADREMDVVLIGPSRGVLIVEVKGGLVAGSDTGWTSYDQRIKDPVRQAEMCKHALIRYLKTTAVGTSGFFIDHAIAVPDVMCPADGLGPAAPRRLVIDKLDLQHPEAAIARLLHEREPVPGDRVEAFVAALRPNATFDASDRTYFDAAAAAMDQTTRERLSIARSMDSNARVLVEGGAGSGKSWLVRDWAQRATGRGERCAVVCFNRPMADRLASQLEDCSATVDSYHNLLVQLLQPFGFEVPPDPSPQWWETVPAESLADQAAQVGTPFDTIVVDEAQDLLPHWLDSLRSLLDPAGPGRLLMVMDPSQAIYVDDWTEPAEFFRATLEVNLRNSRAIARVCTHLGGPPTLANSPTGPSPDFQRVGGAKELRKHVSRSIDHLMNDHGVHPTEIAVLTTHTGTRDALIGSVTSAAGLARWEDRDVDTVLCETIQRTKGLEWTAVIIATLDDPVDPSLLYVGASRPRMHLTMIGPESLSEAAGLRPQGC